MDIIQANPDSIVSLEYTAKNRFRCVFVWYAASAKAFGDCRFVLGLDGAHLKGKYLGILLSGTAVDANGLLFSLAHVVVDAKNDENWHWFAKLLFSVIQIHAMVYLQPHFLLFVSDRPKGLLEAIELMFPGSLHGYCLCHLYKNLHKQFKHPALRGFLYEAAHAINEEEYNKAIDQM